MAPHKNSKSRLIPKAQEPLQQLAVGEGGSISHQNRSAQVVDNVANLLGCH
jgi:hypothetical protein